MLEWYILKGPILCVSANSLSSHYPFVYMKRLYRSGKDRMPGGICGGLGEHIDVNPTIIRIVRVVVTVLSIGFGIIVSILAWVIIPELPEESPVQTTKPGA
jgi:phage shock protein C